jgi:hypothetical protein
MRPEILKVAVRPFHAGQTTAPAFALMSFRGIERRRIRAHPVPSFKLASTGLMKAGETSLSASD